MSWLYLLNFVVLQWFFVRLAKILEEDNSISGWTFLVGVMPLTGWWNDYVFIR